MFTYATETYYQNKIEKLEKDLEWTKAKLKKLQEKLQEEESDSDE